MTTAEYLAALDRLGMGPASQTTTRALGVKDVGTLQRWGNGKRAVPGPVELLLQMYLAHGVPAHLIDEPATQRISFANTRRRIPTKLQTRRK